jgi:uncharacterized protein YdaU (DUF1376 family)
VNKSPAFQFYPKDFLMDDKVAVMNLEQLGAYTKLLCYCWNNNGLPNDEEELREMCGNPENWERIWRKISKCFYENSGKLHNKRLDKEREKQRHWKEKSREGGLKSGEIRRKKSRGKMKGGSNKTKGGSTKREPNTKPPSSSPSSSSSSSSSSEKRKSPKGDSLTSEAKPISEREEILLKWNDFAEKHGLASIQTIRKGSTREKLLRARMSEKDFNFDFLLEMIANSPFLLGKSKEPFFVTFDWIIKPSNYQKIVEGNYLQRRGQGKFVTGGDW